MWRQAATLPERVPAGPLAALRAQRRCARRQAARSCIAMQPASSEAERSQQQWRRPLSCTNPDSGAGLCAAEAADGPPAMVALGKFDALHKGHRALAAAAAQLGGSPWLVSFSGMAQVLGWSARLPLVAPCDRRCVLASWAPHCGGRAPRECAIPFAEVRSMSPESFVELLAGELRVGGVVVGSNYRFGYRAAGTAQLLQQLAPRHGMRVAVLGLVGSAGAPPAQQPPEQGEGLGRDSPGQAADEREAVRRAVSSSRVRHALARGDMADAEDCLGRRYRLVASLAGPPPGGPPHGGCAAAAGDACLPAATLLNQAPCPGRYEVLAWVAGRDTLEEVAAPRSAVLHMEEAGLRLEGGVGLLGLPGGHHLVLDFL